MRLENYSRKPIPKFSNFPIFLTAYQASQKCCSLPCHRTLRTLSHCHIVTGGGVCDLCDKCCDKSKEERGWQVGPLVPIFTFHLSPFTSPLARVGVSI